MAAVAGVRWSVLAVLAVLVLDASSLQGRDVVLWFWAPW